MFSLNFMFFCSLIGELCTKKENYKTSCNCNFGHECISVYTRSAINDTDGDKFLGNSIFIQDIWVSHVRLCS